jgi:hypothetical protein
MRAIPSSALKYSRNVRWLSSAPTGLLSIRNFTGVKLIPPSCTGQSYFLPAAINIISPLAVPSPPRQMRVEHDDSHRHDGTPVGYLSSTGEGWRRKRYPRQGHRGGFECGGNRGCPRRRLRTSGACSLPLFSFDFSQPLCQHGPSARFPACVVTANIVAHLSRLYFCRLCHRPVVPHMELQRLSECPATHQTDRQGCCPYNLPMTPWQSKSALKSCSQADAHGTDLVSEAFKNCGRMSCILFRTAAPPG